MADLLLWPLRWILTVLVVGEQPCARRCCGRMTSGVSIYCIRHTREIRLRDREVSDG